MQNPGKTRGQIEREVRILSERTRGDDLDHLSTLDALKFLSRTYGEALSLPEWQRVNTNAADDMVVRSAMGTAAIVETFSTNVGNAMLQAVEDEPSTCDGWVLETESINFLPATWFTQEFAGRLERLEKGQPATSMGYGTKGEPFQLCRYAGQFVIDEQDLLNGQTVGATKLAAVEQALAASRLRDDLVYSLLLSNPTLTADNTALFHSNHSNLATGGGSALGATSLDSGMAAIGKQHLTAFTDRYPVHSNLKGKYLVVPPDIVGPARRFVRDMTLDDAGDLKVRQESRLSSLSIVDPHSGNVVAGSATNWLLTAKSSARPSIVVAGLSGFSGPQLRRFDITQGQWGMGWDISLDICVAAVDYRGVYFSVGA